jgi:hypothetical protein
MTGERQSRAWSTRREAYSYRANATATAATRQGTRADVRIYETTIQQSRTSRSSRRSVRAAQLSASRHKHRVPRTTAGPCRRPSRQGASCARAATAGGRGVLATGRPSDEEQRGRPRRPLERRPQGPRSRRRCPSSTSTKRPGRFVSPSCDAPLQSSLDENNSSVPPPSLRPRDERATGGNDFVTVDYVRQVSARGGCGSASHADVRLVD